MNQTWVQFDWMVDCDDMTYEGHLKKMNEGTVQFKRQDAGMRAKSVLFGTGETGKVQEWWREVSCSNTFLQGHLQNSEHNSGPLIQRFRCTNQGDPLNPDIDDVISFKELYESMKSLGLGRKSQNIFWLQPSCVLEIFNSLMTLCTPKVRDTQKAQIRSTLRPYFSEWRLNH